ncbi:MAG: LysM peptidoglycan-binding domain-containing protein [Akkermansiaceae bacterium]|nr:LysM peptidoglycan-binding domain-containing protein [Akkermansiaceae bacterium]
MFAYPKQSFMIAAMRFVARILAPLLFAPLFTQCGSIIAPPTNTVTGPFDRRGNYIEDWTDKPEKWYRPATPSKKSKPKPKPTIAKKDKPPEIAVVKPKPVVVKPKPKPKAVRYKVRKGDNLTKIGRKYGVSVSSLRRANGISGDLIRIGQVLKIPR